MRLILGLIIIGTMSSCGIKGKPLPPLPEEPLVTEEKSAVVSAAPVAVPVKSPVKKKKNK